MWAVTCFSVRAGYRRRGVTYALAAAGFREVSRPTKRRVVMRVDFDEFDEEA